MGKSRSKTHQSPKAIFVTVTKEGLQEAIAHKDCATRIKAQAPLACNDIRVVRAFERVLLEEFAERGNATSQKLLPEHRAAYPDYHYPPNEGWVHAPARIASPPHLSNPSPGRHDEHTDRPAQLLCPGVGDWRRTPARRG